MVSSMEEAQSQLKKELEKFQGIQKSKTTCTYFILGLYDVCFRSKRALSTVHTHVIYYSYINITFIEGYR